MASREAGKRMLQLWMFNGKTRASRTGLLSQAQHVLKSGQVEEPAWFKPMKEAPPLPTFSGPRPPMLEFPEDKLVGTFLRRNPAVHSIPVDLNSDEPHISLRFAWRQLELIEQGMDKEKAYETVKAEMSAKIDKAVADVVSQGGSRTPKSSQSVLGLLQAQEEVVLQTKGILKNGAETATIRPPPPRVFPPSSGGWTRPGSDE